MRLTLLTLCLIYGLTTFSAAAPSDSPIFGRLAFNHIQQLESDFSKYHDTLCADGFNTYGFYDKIIDPLNSGAAIDQTYLNAWELRNSKLRSDRFAIWQEKEFYIAALIHAGIHQATPSFLATQHLNAATIRQFTTDFQQLNDLFEKWKYLSQYSQETITPKDQQDRLYTFYDYTQLARTLLQRMGQAPALDSLPPSSTAIQGELRMGASLSYLAGQLFVRNSSNALNQLNPLRYMLPQSWRRSISKALFRNYTPLTDSGGISGLFKGLKEVRGYQVKLQGKYNLAQIPLKGIPGRKVVNLFLPPHRSDVADAVLMSRLNEEIGPYLLFANPSAFAGNYVFGQMLASLPEFISVGKWRGFPALSPTDKLIQSLEDERSVNVINYPQGLLSSIGEFLPINSAFVLKLLKPLLDRGFEVNLIPLSYEVDSRFMSKTGAVDDIHLEIAIHPPHLHSTVKTLVKKQLSAQSFEGDSPKTRYIDHFLSTLWLEETIEHGELSLNEMLDRTESSLGIRNTLNDHEY